MKRATHQTLTISLAVCLAVPGVSLALRQAGAAPAGHVLGKKQDGDSDKKDSTKPPFKGMTKAQAKKEYGEPDSVGHRDGEELWTYVLNRGESYGKSFIPFAPVTKLRYRLLTFKDGKVVRFRWDAPKED